MEESKLELLHLIENAILFYDKLITYASGQDKIELIGERSALRDEWEEVQIQLNELQFYNN